MSAAEILAQLRRLTPEEIAALRRSLDEAGMSSEVRGTGARSPGYESLFGCLADDATFEVPERHRWRPVPRFD